MLGARSSGRVALVGGLAAASVGTLCLLIFFFKWRRREKRKNQAGGGSTSTGVQCDALLDPALSSVYRAIEDVINLDTRDPDVLNSIDIFVDAGRALLESWRNRLSPLPVRNRQSVAAQRMLAMAGTRDAASYQDSAVDLQADFDHNNANNAAGSHQNNLLLFNNSRNNVDFELLSNASSDVSFLSAVEELEELDRILLERFGSAAYDDAMKLAQKTIREGDNQLIPCRTFRTAKVGCSSDEEFLAKMHLIRGGFDIYLADQLKQKEFQILGREIFRKIVDESGGNTVGFTTAFDELLRFCCDPANLEQFRDELATRHVSRIGFYDVVLDFVLLDALDELDETPASVHNALASSWLPESLKKGALQAAVSTALRAKRARMKYSDGFMSRYYGVSDYLSVPLAWAILGPACPLQEKLASFQQLVSCYLKDLFSSDHVAFTTPEETGVTVGEVTDRYIGRMCLIFGIDRSSLALPQ